MRPLLLSPLFAHTQSLQGVGAQVAKLLEKVAGSKIIHLLFHFPSGLIDRSYHPTISEAIAGKIATFTVKTVEHHVPSSKKRPYKITVEDHTGSMDIIFFNGHRKFLEQRFPQGQEIIISGNVERFNNKIQMTHPDYVYSPHEVKQFEEKEAIYPLTGGLFPKVLRKAILHGLQKIPDLPEWIDPTLLAQKGWPSFHEALKQVHFPQNQKDLDPNSPARQRLAYDEFLANQLALALIREKYKHTDGQITFHRDGQLIEKARSLLPFTLTAGQEQVLAEILSDMKSDIRMLRLLQGDVGAGKTIIAFLSMCAAIESGFQTALMVPTEILAHQHFESLKPYADALNIKIDLLTGRHQGKARQEILENLYSGKTNLLIGTHALFQDDVVYQKLGFVIVDEQHRFGVDQRLRFSDKGSKTDILVMTATPIPRTLTLTYYGDMDVSKLTDKPPGRKPIDTRSLSLEKVDDVILGLKRALEKGDQIYWICPLVEESEKLDLSAATERFKSLNYLYPNQVGLVHGKMKSTEKDTVMHQFLEGKLRILVATTVIEVGVNVPNANIMVIEHVERFGLSQLHQLRGRVGRGDKASFCIMLYDMPLSPGSQRRIEVMRQTEDGFLIAEEDLKLRGNGEILGTKQSGFPEFKAAQLEFHESLLHLARKDSDYILNLDPTLSTLRGQALKHLLYLWEKDSAVHYMRAG